MGTHKATTFFVSVALYSITHNYFYLLNHSLLMDITFKVFPIFWYYKQ